MYSNLKFEDLCNLDNYSQVHLGNLYVKYNITVEDNYLAVIWIIWQLILIQISTQQSDQLALVHLNVRSLPSHHKELKVILDTVLTQLIDSVLNQLVYSSQSVCIHSMWK